MIVLGRNFCVVATVLSLVGPCLGFWRLPCHFNSALARIDPIVDFGRPANHLHSIHGGQKLSFTSTSADLMTSSCTSCQVEQDKSAYWAPTLLFMYNNGTTIPVRQVDMLAYYLLFGENIKAFPKGFQLLAGDKNLREFPWPVPDPAKSSWRGDQVSQKALAQKAIGFNCLDYAGQAEPTLFRHTLPNKEFLSKKCRDGLRVEIMFPSCWNGKDLDSPNHKSHMAYPDHVMDGTCPEGFKTRLPSLLYETIYDTYAFRGAEGKFVFANGDETGCGYHADFITGWDVDFLQKAVNTCTNPSGKVEDCPMFTLQSREKASQCKLDIPKEIKDEKCGGLRQGLCGDVKADSETEDVQIAQAPPRQDPAPAFAAAPAPPPAVTPLAAPVAAFSPQAARQSPAVTPPSLAAQPVEYESPDIQALDVDRRVDPIETPSPTCNNNTCTTVISTITSTSAGVVYSVIVEEVDVTVTLTTTTTLTTPCSTSRHVHHAMRVHHPASRQYV